MLTGRLASSFGHCSGWLDLNAISTATTDSDTDSRPDGSSVASRQYSVTICQLGEDMNVEIEH